VALLSSFSKKKTKNNRKGNAVWNQADRVIRRGIEERRAEKRIIL